MTGCGVSPSNAGYVSRTAGLGGLYKLSSQTSARAGLATARDAAALAEANKKKQATQAQPAATKPITTNKVNQQTEERKSCRS